MHGVQPQLSPHSSTNCGFITGKAGNTFVGGFGVFLAWFGGFFGFVLA